MLRRNFDFNSCLCAISPNQLNVCFTVCWNMNSRYMLDWDGIVEELLAFISCPAGTGKVFKCFSYAEGFSETASRLKPQRDSPVC
jgi:hypothetical protein